MSCIQSRSPRLELAGKIRLDKSRSHGRHALTCSCPPHTHHTDCAALSVSVRGCTCNLAHRDSRQQLGSLRLNSARMCSSARVWPEYWSSWWWCDQDMYSMDGVGRTCPCTCSRRTTDNSTSYKHEVVCKHNPACTCKIPCLMPLAH